MTVLSPARLENRECGFLGGVEIDSDYYGFLIEQGVCSNDIWCADHEFAYELDHTECPDFFDFLAKVALDIWDETAWGGGVGLREILPMTLLELYEPWLL